MSIATEIDPLPMLADTELTVRSPFENTTVGTVAQHTVADCAPILERAVRAARAAANTTRFERAKVLDDTAELLLARAEYAAELIVAEAGKTIRQARKEVSRAVNTLRLSAAEARRNAGEVIPFDAFEGAENRRGWFTREPLGVILAITPYNDPLNLVAHKIGPAVAGGNAVILKPSQLTPLSARFLVGLMTEAGLAADTVTVVHGNREMTSWFVRAREVRMVSFTGGFQTGEAISRDAGLKRIAMELGGNAPVLVFADADIPAAVESCVSGAFWAAGQNCIGAQRIFVARERFDEFAAAFAERTKALVAGDPSLESTEVGPMITAQAARDTLERVRQTVREGARVLTGGTVDGAVFRPTVLVDVPHSSPCWREEAFAPIVTLEPFDDVDHAISMANAIDYSLQAGIFTSDFNTALRVSEAIEAGGVMVNDTSDFRIDAMPFGGAKYGGIGREGVHFAFEEMTQPKVVVLTTA